MRTLASLVVLLAALLATTVASAQQLTAREHFARGTTAYQQGDYDTAITEWNAAYAEDPRPLIQYNLSQAYERLGRMPEAAAALENYVAHADAHDPNQADARARLSSLHERLARTAVRIVGGPESATILIDGEDHGRTPHPDPITVTPGSHRIVVREPGYADFNATVVVPGGQAVEVDVDMQQSGAGGGGGGGGGDIGPHRYGSHPDMLGPIILLGSGGLVTVVGFILGGVALGNASSATSSTGPDADGARGLALGADICIFGGLAIAAGGAIWLALTLSSNSAPNETQGATPQQAFLVTPYLGPHEAGATARLAF